MTTEIGLLEGVAQICNGGFGGGGRIRTCEARRATDLQSVGISRSPTPPCGSEGIVLRIVLVVQLVMARVSVSSGAFRRVLLAAGFNVTQQISRCAIWNILIIPTFEVW